MLKKAVLIFAVFALIIARSAIVAAAEEPVPANAPATPSAPKAASADETKKLNDLDAFGNKICKQLLSGSTEVFKNMNFEFVIRLSVTTAELDALGKSVSELASDTLAVSMTTADSAPPKAEKCEVSKKEILPCNELFYMIAKSPNVQEAFKDNDKLSDTDRIARVSKAAKETGVASCGALHVKSKAKGDPELTETIAAGMIGDKWQVLEMINAEDKKK